MTLAVIALSVLGALVALLWTVYRLKPARFQVKVAVTKWVSLDIQMHAPQADTLSGSRRQQRTRRKADLPDHPQPSE